MNFPKRLYYTIRPLIPRGLQLSIRKPIAKFKLKKYRGVWPIDENAWEIPDRWTGWPEDKDFAFVLMHDVDTQKGHDNCRKLMDIEEEMGFRSAFYFVAERYKIDNDLLHEIKQRGFDIGVHGLKHDGKLFSSKKVFNKRAKKINKYLNEWGTMGFSSPSMHRNHSWMGALKIEYGTTTFDTDPFEPQPDPIKSIFPLWIATNGNDNKGYIEIPYTLPQDHLVFIMLEFNDLTIWKQKLEWLANKQGMALLNTHPDYMSFDNKHGFEQYPAAYYKEFLAHLKNDYAGRYYHCMPSQLAQFWKNIEKID